MTTDWSPTAATSASVTTASRPSSTSPKRSACVPANNDDGYNFTTAGDGVLPLQKFLNTVGEKGYHFSNYEQDNAPGAADQSLDDSRISADNISHWRG